MYISQWDGEGTGDSNRGYRLIDLFYACFVSVSRCGCDLDSKNEDTAFALRSDFGYRPFGTSNFIYFKFAT